jgi:hypothetical protein
MSRGYTMVLARTAPVAPATASPQGVIGASFDSPAMSCIAKGYPLLNFPQRSAFRQPVTVVAEVV